MPSYRCTSWMSLHILNARHSPGFFPKPFACASFAARISTERTNSLVCSGLNSLSTTNSQKIARFSAGRYWMCERFSAFHSGLK
jgi:hypothetical protein